MAKIPRRTSAPCQSLCSVSSQKPASDRACLQAVTGAWHTSLRAGWMQVLISTCPQMFICHTGLCGGSGFEFPLSIKPARYLNSSFLLPRSALWASSSEIFSGYVSCSFHFPPSHFKIFFLKFLFLLGKTVVYMIYLFQGKLESQTKRNARTEKLFPVQVYSSIVTKL